MAIIMEVLAALVKVSTERLLQAVEASKESRMMKVLTMKMIIQMRAEAKATMSRKKMKVPITMNLLVTITVSRTVANAAAQGQTPTPLITGKVQAP